MRSSCLINCHNYVDYVGEAIDSALAQSKPFDEVIVVDDGSSDGSVDRIRKDYGGHAKVRLIAKPQGGQLSCFHVGLAESSGDLLFFLDADDRYAPEMLRRVTDLYQRRPEIGFVSTGYRRFGAIEGWHPPASGSRRRGISVASAVLHRCWIGNPTSCLSMRRTMAQKVLPYPDESDWQTRADDVLVLGSSIMGADKYHLELPLVEYRIHDRNHFAGKRLDAVGKMQYALCVERMVNWYLRAARVDRDSIAYLLHREFRTCERPSSKELRSYLRMLGRGRLPWSTRLDYALNMVLHYANEFRRRKGTPSAVEPDVTVTESPRHANPTGTSQSNVKAA
ncbi:glycosyltransferase family 2 protein [Crateriforma conspicua]|uniref:Hyaluronan synthase n=1 Tax=Crateriforma conspicua TaxID=2527996 RepID=A0A5C5YC60_9PLAN|nr:glycosyltransferase family 2 protein [Crateriforma conspicua]TWT72519.1 Hyaluronan synthase [Crateriforma conspicua]